MAMNFLRQHWKVLLSIVVCMLLSTFIGSRFAGHPDIAVAIGCLACGWGFSLMWKRARMTGALEAGKFQEALELSQKELGCCKS
jgi:uncharacterized membrane protein YfcA